MNKAYVIAAAAAAGLTLISASPPGSGAGDERDDYPPCSRTVTDNCIQDRSGPVREPEGLALDAMPSEGDPGPAAAAGGPYERVPAGMVARRHYPPCTATRQDSCQQGRSRHVRYARRVRHAGERG